MTVLIIVLCLLTAASAVATIYFRTKGQSFNGMLCKFLSSFGFMSIAIAGFCSNHLSDPYYFFLAVFGLMFGQGGDILLGLKEIAPKFRSRLMAMGTASFLCCHVFFIAAFIKVAGFSVFPFLTAAVIFAVATVLIKILKFNVDTKMFILLAAYYSILFAKCIMSFIALYRTGINAFVFTSVGSVFFIISDTVLAFLYFFPVKSKNKLVAVELGTYYPAQIFLALSVRFMPAI